MGEIVHVDFKIGLSQSQRNHWLGRLEDSERAVEIAKRVLGLLPVELGLDGTDRFDVFPDD